MPPAIKLCAGEFLPESPPALEPPMKDPEIFNVVAQIWHVFGGESVIWRVG